MNNRKTVIVLILLFLLVGGAGGYLLWRVNQEKTVAPTDSDAGFEEEVCSETRLSISFSPLNSQEGSLKVTSKREKAKIDKEGNLITQTFKNSCDLIDSIKAVPKEGYVFVHWDDASGGRTITDAEIELQYKDYIKQGNSILRAVYAPEDTLATYTLEYTASCPGYTEEVSSLFTCTNPIGGGEISKEDSSSDNSGCLKQVVPKGKSSMPVYVAALKGSSCKFKNWEIDGKNVGSEVPHLVKEVGSNLKITAVFEYIYNGSPFSLKYSSKGEGSLKVDGKDVRVYPVSVNFVPSQQYPNIPQIEAVPKEGWVFDRWQNNLGGLFSSQDAMKNPRKDIDKKADLDIIALYKREGEPRAQQYTLRYEAGKGGKLSKDGEVSSTLPISLSVDSGSSGPSIKAEADTGYKFVHWLDSATGMKDTSNLATSNPRKDTNVTKDIAVKAFFQSTSNPEPPKPPVDSDTDTPITEPEETMPQTAVLPNKSLYIMTLGALVLCLGMVWQYIPTQIIKRRE